MKFKITQLKLYTIMGFTFLLNKSLEDEKGIPKKEKKKKKGELCT